ncbi:MAG TPA: c-type cytochrome [Bryobacteraceae bacterium]|nr:c-type cytochrome [Bryobacteraceae bacterium]
MKLTIMMAAAIFAAQIGGAQTPEGKTAEQVYKNIQQLKGTPADQLIASMQFISVSLGVECDACHVADRAADDKNNKKTAREMMAMTAAINKDSFRGRQQVTCYSCHRGSLHPASVPPVQDSDSPAAHSPATPAASANAAPPPTVDDIINKYLAAAGGADAMKTVTSRTMKGTLMAMGNETAIDLYTKAPNKRVSIAHMSPTSDSYTAFDGTVGWLATTGRPAREMSPAEAFAASLDADFNLVADLKQIFPQIRRGRPTEIGGAPCETLSASKPGEPPVNLYFDQQSGLLVRMVRYSQTPMGRMPTQIDYADYREMGGVKTPWRWTLARANGRFTIQLKEVKVNLPVEDSKFTKPEGEMK